ncbi:MAG: hypothetical protein ABIH83_01235 [Candidatus Micrarchaeota archaeon]
MTCGIKFFVAVFLLFPLIFAVASVELISPIDGLRTNSSSVDFSFVYTGESQESDAATCFFLSEGSSPLGPLRVPAGEKIVFTSKNMEAKTYLWSVACNGIYSDYRSLLVETGPIVKDSPLTFMIHDIGGIPSELFQTRSILQNTTAQAWVSWFKEKDKGTYSFSELFSIFLSSRQSKDSFGWLLWPIYAIALSGVALYVKIYSSKNDEKPKEVPSSQPKEPESF